jgi:hypothetical protein
MDGRIPRALERENLEDVVRIGLPGGLPLLENASPTCNMFDLKNLGSGGEVMA